MKRVILVVLSLFLMAMLTSVFVGCGANIKAENEKLKGQITTLQADNDKLRVEVQQLKEDAQKAAADKDATIANLTNENATLKKEVEDLKAKLPKKKKKR